MTNNVVCKKCNNLVNDWCEKVIDSPDPDMQRDCQHFCEKKNADRIRSMTDEELAVLLADEIPHGDCYNCNLDCSTSEGDKFNDSCHNAFYKWLQQPAEQKSYNKIIKSC